MIEIEIQDIRFMEQDSHILLIKNISQLLKSEQQKNESKYQEMLTATFSHELMNPLNSIINLSEIV